MLTRQEKEQLYAKFEEEFEECEQYWEEKLNEYGESLKRLENEIHNNQQQELEEYQKDFQNARPNLFRYKENLHNIRPNSQVINLRFQIEKLVKSQQYIQAAHLKKKLIKLEEKNHNQNTRREINKRENKFLYLKKKHENELHALEKKINIGKEEMIKAREKDFESIHLKFKVLKEKKEKQHRHEMIVEEKRLKGFKPSSKYLFNSITG
jgi:hypothetical protein